MLLLEPLHLVQAGLGKRYFGFVAGRRLKRKTGEPVVFVVPSNLKPTGTFAGFYPWVGFEISPQNRWLRGGAEMGFSLKINREFCRQEPAKVPNDRA